MFVRVPRAFSQGLWAAVAATFIAVPALASAWLGVMVQPADRDLIEALEVDVDGGVVIADVVTDSPADDAGLREGDVIISVEGEDVRSVTGFVRDIRRFDAGERIDIEVVRNGRVRSLTATLDESEDRGERDRGFFAEPRAKRAPEAPRAPRSRHDEHDAHENHDEDGNTWFNVDPHSFDFEFGPHLQRLGNFFARPRLGIEMRDLDEDLAPYFGTEVGNGVLVLEVMEDTVAEEVGLRAGDVILEIDEERVGRAADLREALVAHEGESVALLVRRRGEDLVIEAELDEPKRRSLKIDRVLGDRGNVDEELDELRDELRELREELRELRRDER